MKFAVAFSLSAAVVSAASFYSGATVNLKCDDATFDSAGGITATSVEDCKSSCSSQFGSGASVTNDTTGLVTGLADDKYAGCSFPAEYILVEETAVPCAWTSPSLGTGFFTAIDSNDMVSKVTILSATLSAAVDVSAAGTWTIYPASSAVANCSTTAPTDDTWITGAGVSAAATVVDATTVAVNVTDFYLANDADADAGKMFVFVVVPAGSIASPDATTNTVTTVSDGPMQLGVSAACGALTDCDACIASCQWCQLTLGTDSVNGVCGATEGQCYAQTSPYGVLGWYKDQCLTAETSSSTTSTAAGASSVVALSVAGAVVLGAALAL